MGTGKRAAKILHVATKIAKSFLRFQFTSPYVKYLEEYRITNFASVVSSIGGSLGLFLGFSCFGIVWAAIEKAAENKTKDRQRIGELKIVSAKQ